MPTGNALRLIVADPKKAHSNILAHNLFFHHDVIMFDDGLRLFCECLGPKDYDLIVCTTDLKGPNAFDMVKMIRSFEIDKPIIILTHRLDEGMKVAKLSQERFPQGNVFVLHDSQIILFLKKFKQTTKE